MTFHFAWVDETETVFGPEHQREDEQVFAFSIEHTEGDFPTLSIDIGNPRRRLLDQTGIWAWLSEDGQPLFFGRLVAVPEELAAEMVRLSFVARPADYDDRRRALAETLKVAPFWDPVWLVDERLDDPDTVLEARTALWHIDRVTHDVTISDILTGEDGTIGFGPGEVDYDSLDVTYGSPPARRVHIEAEVSWDQTAAGVIDISEQLTGAFRAAGTPRAGLISSFTGQGLADDWPEAEADLGGGWAIETATLQRADGVWTDQRSIDVGIRESRSAGVRVSFGGGGGGSAADQVTSSPASARFYAWEFKPVLTLGYDVARQRIERVNFTVGADVQRVFSEPGTEDEIILSLASRKISEEVEGELPIGDLRRPAYIKTDRGRRSLDYLVVLARSRLLARARAVEVSFRVPWSLGPQLSCRHDVVLTDERLPDGTAGGKVIGYRLEADGEGNRRAEVRIGCTIGTGTTVAPIEGEPTWADDYSEGYQVYAGASLMPVAGDVTYDDPSGTPVDDDGIDFMDLRPDDMLLRLDVINGETAQRGVLDRGGFGDIDTAIEALNAVHTEVWLELVPLVGGPFETVYDIETSALMVPRTITL